MDFSRIRDFTWRVSDCEELGGLCTGDDGVGLVYILLSEMPSFLPALIMLFFTCK